MSTAAIEKPMLFSAPMVLAILDGRKTQTRRLVKPQFKLCRWVHQDGSIETERCFKDGSGRIPCPHPVGSRIWVRETWAQDKCVGDDTIYYQADHPGKRTWVGSWRLSIHMPRWASRITLEVTDVRVQRLDEITPDDVFAEGIGAFPSAFPDVAQEMFARLWNAIHGSDAWEANPWVWAYTFKRVESEAGHGK